MSVLVSLALSGARVSRCASLCQGRGCSDVYRFVREGEGVAMCIALLHLPHSDLRVASMFVSIRSRSLLVAHRFGDAEGVGYALGVHLGR